MSDIINAGMNTISGRSLSAPTNWKPTSRAPIATKKTITAMAAPTSPSSPNPNSPKSSSILREAAARKIAAISPRTRGMAFSTETTIATVFSAAENRNGATTGPPPYVYSPYGGGGTTCGASDGSNTGSPIHPLPSQYRWVPGGSPAALYQPGSATIASNCRPCPQLSSK